MIHGDSMKATTDQSGFEFLCPHCSQSLEATPDLFGQNLNCPMCGNNIAVPNSKKEPAPRFPSTHVRNLAIAALASTILTSAFWWTTPFIARAKGKQATEGAKTALKEAFGNLGPSKSENDKEKKLEAVLKSKISLKFEGNQRVTITNNSDFEIKSLAFEYLNEEELRVATGDVTFRGNALKSGQTVTVDISSRETIKPDFNVRPWYLNFSSMMDAVHFPK